MDIRALLLFISFAAAINALVAGLLFRSTRLSGPLMWSVGAVCICVGVLLVGLRNHVTDFSSIVIGNGLILLGYSITWDGVRRFVGRTFAISVVATSIVIVLGGSYSLYYYSTVNVSLSMRVLIISALVLFTNASIANTLFVEKLGHRAATSVGALFGFNGILWIVRVVEMMAGSDTLSFLRSGMVTSVFLVWSGLFLLACTVGEVYMVKEEVGGPELGPPIRELLFSSRR